MSDAVELLYNPLEPGFLADPYPSYRRLRDTAPLHRSPLGFWVAAGHALCNTLLRHSSSSVDYANSSDYAPTSGSVKMRTLKQADILLFQDPPRHTALRGRVAPAFTRSRMRTLIEFVDSRVSESVDRLRQGDLVDFVGDVAYPMAIDIISMILGLEAEHFAAVRAWSKDIARGLDPDFTLPPDAIERSERAIEAATAFLTVELDRRRSGTHSGLLSMLSQPSVEHRDLTEQEIVNLCLLLMLAGHETTANLLANSLHALLLDQHQHARQRLSNDDSVIPTAIDELLRYDSPIQISKRIPLIKLEFDAITLAPGDMVVLLLGSANRDELVFERPDDLVLDRSPNAHLGFGGGVHHCLGAPLARLEAHQALLHLSPLLPDLELVEDPIPIRPGVSVRGVERLLVRRR